MGGKDQMMKHMCLGCGRYFATEEKPERCPYCADVYLTNNIIPGVPPPIGEEWNILTPCNHRFITDMPGDVITCPTCGHSGEGELEGRTLKDWQEEQLKRMEIS